MNELYINKFILGNARDKIKLLDNKSIRCCVTSPPYYQLRNYDCDGQIGLEDTPEEFIANLVEVFEEVKRVLTDDGTLWVNIGDSYASIAGGYDTTGSRGSSAVISPGTQAAVLSGKKRTAPAGLKPKDLIGIPWMLAFALRAAGWYLRQDIIWHKPNPMPESVTDRCTKSHEYIFLLSKSKKYYYDSLSIATPLTSSTLNRVSQDVDNQSGSSRVPGKVNGNMKAVVKGLTFGGAKGREYAENIKEGDPNYRNGSEQWGRQYNISETGTANKKSVWTVTTKPYSDAHFATFPQELIVDCIKAGSEPKDIILDPFSGAGTTALVAAKLDRNFVGIELNQKYIDISNRRLDKELGLFRK